MRTRTFAAALLLGLAAGACADEDSPTEFGPTGNITGTWLLEEEHGATYVKVGPSDIRIYTQNDTCFSRRDYEIAAVEGVMFTVVSDTLEAQWSFELESGTLQLSDGTSTVALVPSDVSVESLQLCAAVVIFDNLHPSCAELPAIAVGGSLTGVLEDGDAEWGGTWYDLYSLRLSATATVTITLSSVDGDLDMWLGVYDYTGSERIIRNDDIDYDGGVYDSRVTVELPAGCWVIVANSYDGDDAGEDGGNYRLEVSGDAPVEPDFPTAACNTLPQLALDGSVMGLLEDADTHWSDGTYYDTYSLQLDAETDVTIEHRAGADDVLDPYMMLYNDDATERLDENDDGAGDLDSRIAGTYGPGCYIVVAGSWSDDPSGEGTYMVSATTGTVDPAFPHDVCVNLPMVAPGDVVTGTLEAGDTTWFDTWIDLYSLQITETTNIRATLVEAGSGIDTYLGVWDFQAGTRLVRNDDIDYDSGDYNSRIEYTFEPGCYIVGANSYEGDDAGETGGAYELTIGTF